MRSDEETLVIVGHQRTGSTVLRKILATDPGLRDLGEQFSRRGSDLDRRAVRVVEGLLGRRLRVDRTPPLRKLSPEPARP